MPAPNAGFRAIAAGLYHSLGLRADGTVVAWGAGQTGDVNFPNYGQSVVASPNADFVAIAAGEVRSVGLKGRAGDFDLDGDVDLADFSAFQACAAQGSPAATCRRGDANSDGSVDEHDLFSFSAALAGPRS